MVAKAANLIIAYPDPPDIKAVSGAFPSLPTLRLARTPS
jgi:hypothetical protein